MSELDCSVLPLLLIAEADGSPLFVIHERKVGGGGETAFRELGGGPRIDQWDIRQTQRLQIVDLCHGVVS